MSSSPKPRDLTGSLVRYGEKGKAPRSVQPAKQKNERVMAFDAFSFGVWCAVFCLFAAQVLLILLPEFI